MLIERRTLNSKVAWRIFGLFVLSALVPIIIMAALAFVHVSSVITDQSEQQLRHQSKNYGMSVLAKLQHARARLQSISVNPEVITKLTVTDPVLPPMFTAVTVQETSGELSSLLGETISLAELSNSMQQPLDIKLFLMPSMVDTSGLASSQKLYLRFIPDPEKLDSAILLAELNPDYVWGRTDELPLITEFCALSADVDAELVFCSQSVPEKIFQVQSFQQHSEVLHWARNDEKYLAVYRELYLENQFSYPGLIIVAFQPNSHALAPLAAFTQLFPAILAIAVFVVLLLSLSQIRRSLVPLEKLKAGTVEIANRRFTSRVEVSSDDEFGDLAQAFNGMSNRLNKQFQALNTLARIDQLLLINPNYKQATTLILEHLPDILPCDVACITIIESSPAIARAYIRKYSGSAQTILTDLTLGPSAFEALQTFAKPRFIDLQRSNMVETYLSPLIQSDIDYCWLIAIFQNTHLIGYIALGYHQPTQLEQSDLTQLNDVAARIAVVSTAWEREQKLYQQAHYDALTELPNRQLLLEMLNREIMTSQRDDSLLALLFIDLDHFKNINDTLGHAIGDQLLRQVAERLRNCVKATDTVARLGGDEFNLILPQLNTPREASKIAEQVISTLEKVFKLEGQRHYVSASIGIALHPYDGVTSAELMRNADIAMYRAKQDGRGRYCFFKEQMNIAISKRTRLERDLRQALAHDQFMLYFQPQLNLTTNIITSAETLLRWQHPQDGVISPDLFISLAEETGLIEPIGEWILQHAIKQLRTWYTQGFVLHHLAVNVSSRQFQIPDFAMRVKNHLKTNEISPRCLELEITESLFVDKTESINNSLIQLHQAGVKLAIDDFGTGYSSLSYLKRLPIDVLKIDRSFIDKVPIDDDAVALVRSIIAMAKILKKRVVVEGVETAAQIEFIRNSGCHSVQGYYLSPPLSANAFAFFVQHYNAEKPKLVQSA